MANSTIFFDKLVSTNKKFVKDKEFHHLRYLIQG
jgi:hypothetical protein